MLFTFVVIVLFVSSLLLINHWSTNKGIIYLVLFILIISLRQLFFLLLNTNDNVDILSILWIHLDPFSVMIGPLFYYYVRSLIKGKIVFDYQFLLHAIPAIIILINTLPYYFYPFEDKVLMLTGVQKHNSQLDLSDLHYLFFSFTFQRTVSQLLGFCYITNTLWHLYKLKKDAAVFLKKKVKTTINNMLIVTPILMILFLIIILYSNLSAPNKAGLIFKNPIYKVDGYIFFIMLLLPLSFFLMPNWLYNDQEPSFLVEKWRVFISKFSKTNSIEPEPVFIKSDDLNRIVHHMENEKPYLQFNFSLHDISSALNIPYMRITHCFNQQLNISFPSYRNKLRVAHAIRLFKNGMHLTTSIEGIAAKSGFKSKSIFYAAFRAEHGMNPSEWINKNIS